MTWILEEHIWNEKKTRYYGATFVSSVSGQRFYLAWRKNKEVFRNGKESQTHAMNSEEGAGWAIDYRTLCQMRSRGIEIVGVYVHNRNDVYLAKIKDFFEFARMKDYTTEGGALQKYLHLDYFKCRAETSLRWNRPKRPKTS